MNAEHIFTGKWTEAMGLMALPTNAPSSLKLLAHLVDEMWHCAGDTSPDVKLNYIKVYVICQFHFCFTNSFHGTLKELCWPPFTNLQS